MHYRIIVAIGKEIISLQAAVCPKNCIRGNKPPDVGIVVSGVEIVPAGFDIEVIATVAERVDIGDVGFIVRNIVTAAVRYAYMFSHKILLGKFSNHQDIFQSFCHHLKNFDLV